MLSFLGSKAGKIIIALIVLIIVSYIVYVAYQKSIFGGMSKSKLILSLSNDYALDKIESIKKNDIDVVNSIKNDEGREKLIEFFDWYDENEDIEISDKWIEKQLFKYKIDFVKNPKVLEIKKEVENKVNLVRTFTI